MNNARQLVARIGAALTLLVLVVVPPVLVVRLIGRPWPDWATLRSQVDGGRLTNDTTMRIAAAMFMVIWIWAMIQVASEVFAILRTRSVPIGRATHASLPTPTGGNGALHRLVRIALLGSVTTAATVSSWSSVGIAAAPPLAHLTYPLDAPATAPADSTKSVPSEPSTTTIVTTGRETPLSLAVDLGDETLRDDIIAMNRSSEWSGGVFPAGTLVTVPVAAATTTTAPSTAAGHVAEYEVQANDGMWDVAKALLGNGSLHHELREQLIGQEVAPGIIFDNDTWVIHPGWVFTAPSVQPSNANTISTYTVVEGDTLSDIAESHLGHPDRWTELWELNANQPMNDGRTFTDPNLIIPGWNLTLEAVEAQVNDEPTVVEQPEPTLPAPIPDNAELDEPSLPPSVEIVPEVALPAPSTVPPRAATPAPSSVPAEVLPVPGSSAPVADEDAVDGFESVFADEQRSVWPTLAAGLLLLTGLAETARRLRRRRMASVPLGERPVEPPPVAAGTELAVAQREDAHQLSTLRTLLRQFTPYAREYAEPPPVRAVQLGTDRLELLFTQPAPSPPSGWSSVDGGRSWTHRFEDEATETSRQLLTPALVTIGIRNDDDGHEVLLDLETAARVAIVGDREAALGLARSMVLELATRPLGVPIDVCLVGLHVDSTDLCDRVWTNTTVERSISAARQMLRLHGTGDTDTITAARARLDEDDGDHDPQIFIIDCAALSTTEQTLLEELMKLCQPSSGNAVVLIGEHADVIERITVAGETGCWEQVELRVPNVTLEAAAQAAVMLDSAANGPTEPLPRTVPTDASSNGNSPTSELEPTTHPYAEVENPGLEVEDEEPMGEEEYEPPPYEVLIKVMGTVEVDGGDRKFSSQEVEMLALFTCLRHRSMLTKDLVQTNVGDEISDRTAGNRVSGLRRTLGAGPDGNDLLSKAQAGRYSDGAMQLSHLVLTDYDLLRHRYDASLDMTSFDAIKVLRDGLPLLRGPLFRVRSGYRWVSPEGITSQLQSGVIDYAARLMELAMEVDDIALVLKATSIAGCVLDDPMVELPIRNVEKHYADATGSPELAQSVLAAKHRFMDYVNTEDALAEG